MLSTLLRVSGLKNRSGEVARKLAAAPRPAAIAAPGRTPAPAARVRAHHRRDVRRQQQQDRRILHAHREPDHRADQRAASERRAPRERHHESDRRDHAEAHQHVGLRGVAVARVDEVGREQRAGGQRRAASEVAARERDQQHHGENTRHRRQAAIEEQHAGRVAREQRRVVARGERTEDAQHAQPDLAPDPREVDVRARVDAVLQVEGARRGGAGLEEDHLLVGTRHQVRQAEVERPEAQNRGDEHDHGEGDQVPARKPATTHDIDRGPGAAPAL